MGKIHMPQKSYQFNQFKARSISVSVHKISRSGSSLCKSGSSWCKSGSSALRRRFIKNPYANTFDDLGKAYGAPKVYCEG